MTDCWLIPETRQETIYMKRLKINTCNKPGKPSLFLRSEINTWNKPGQYLLNQHFQIPAAIKRFLQSPSEIKLPTVNPQDKSRLSVSVPHRIFRYSPVKISSRQESPVDWHTTQAPDSPTVVPRLLIFNDQRIFNPPQQSRIYFPPTAVKILLSPAIQDSYILSKTAHQLTCAFITCIS